MTAVAAAPGDGGNEIEQFVARIVRSLNPVPFGRSDRLLLWIISVVVIANLVFVLATLLTR